MAVGLTIDGSQVVYDPRGQMAVSGNPSIVVSRNDQKTSAGTNQARFYIALTGAPLPIGNTVTDAATNEYASVPIENSSGRLAWELRDKNDAITQSGNSNLKLDAKGFSMAVNLGAADAFDNSNPNQVRYQLSAVNYATAKLCFTVSGNLGSTLFMNIRALRGTDSGEDYGSPGTCFSQIALNREIAGNGHVEIEIPFLVEEGPEQGGAQCGF